MTRYFKKEIVSQPFFLNGGRRAPFVAIPGNVGILITDDERIGEELRQAAKRHAGGVVELTQDQFLALKYPNAKPSKLPPLQRPDPPVTGTQQPGIDQLYVKWKIAKGRFTPPNVCAAKQPRLIHVLERHTQSNPDAERRIRAAFDSWYALYCTGQVVPCHVWQYRRSAKDTLGDSRDLPYLKDILLEGLNTGDDRDHVMLTNDDTVLHRETADAVLGMMKQRDAICSFRLNYAKGSMPLTTACLDQIRSTGQADLGRDLFCFRKQWLKEHWHCIPDFVLGELEWDLVMAVMVRRAAGFVTTKGNITEPIPECELARGYVLHEVHQRLWTTEKLQKAPAKIWNNRLMAEWHADNGFENLISKIL